MKITESNFTPGIQYPTIIEKLYNTHRKDGSAIIWYYESIDKWYAGDDLALYLNRFLCRDFLETYKGTFRAVFYEDGNSFHCGNPNGT